MLERGAHPSHSTGAHGTFFCLLAELPALRLRFAWKPPSGCFQLPLWVRKVIRQLGPKEQRRMDDQSPGGTGMPSRLVVQKPSLPSNLQL